MPRHLAIGDIHGCLDALTSLVDFVGIRPGDTVVTLGDYVDRGPDSRGVLDFVIDLGKRHKVVALRGNHEIMMLDAREKKSWYHAWVGYGGEATLRSYASDKGEIGSFDDVPGSHFEFLTSGLKAFYECESHFFVHANVDESTALSRQSDAALYWKKYSEPVRHCSGKVMVCGHTPQESGLPLVDEAAICIDTWAHGGGWLSCLDVDTGTVWQANEAGETRRFSIDRARTDPRS